MKPPISRLPVLLLYRFSNLVQGQSNVLLNVRCIIQAHTGSDTQNGSNNNTNGTDIPINTRNIQCNNCIINNIISLTIFIPNPKS